MGHTWQLRRWKGSRHRVALSAAARDYESSLLLPARGRCTRSRVELGRGERDRLGMPSDGLSYKCSAETCPGRLQTCFCNAEPRILASQGTHLSLSLFLSLSLYLSTSLSFSPFYLLASTRCSMLPLHDRRFQVLWSDYCRRDTCKNTLRALCSLAVNPSPHKERKKQAFGDWKAEETSNYNLAIKKIAS